MAGKGYSKGGSASPANDTKAMEYDPFNDVWVPIEADNSYVAGSRDNEPSDAQIRAEAEASILRSMGRQKSFEEQQGLKVSRIKGRTLVTWEGTTYGYASGELSRRNAHGGKGGGAYDVSGLAERIYGDKSHTATRRLEGYLDSFSSGGHASRRKAELERWGRAKRVA